jgi:hypothetical protein
MCNDACAFAPGAGNGLEAPEGGGSLALEVTSARGPGQRGQPACADAVDRDRRHVERLLQRPA